MKLVELANVLKEVNTQTVGYAAKAINLSVTLRNWLFGYYIRAYELKGEDRARYGGKVIENLSKVLTNQQVKSSSSAHLWQCLQFYNTYPSIMQTVSAQLQKTIPRLSIEILQTVSGELAKQQNNSTIDPHKLLNLLSFSHFVELLKLDTPLKRTFYESECIKGSWSVRELKRQINSLYYERLALSKNKKKLSELSHANAQTSQPLEIIRDPYVFEFLGVKSHEVILENQLNDALLDKLQNFLLELGNGFCFEARNKRILIGDEYFFIDLVLYHRILKCHVLIELKTTKFNHQHIGQLNTYIKYFKRHEMHEGDNPPLGILLCTDKNEALVEYAIDDSAHNIFVSKYKLELPTEAEIKKFIEQEL